MYFSKIFNYKFQTYVHHWSCLNSRLDADDGVRAPVTSKLYIDVQVQSGSP